MSYFAPAAAAAQASLSPFLFNWSPDTQLRNWRAARAKVLAGVAGARCTIACAGDSTTAGVGALGTSAAPVTNGRPTASMPAKLAGYLSQFGLPASAQSYEGNANAQTLDNRLTLVGNAAVSGANAAGGACYEFAGTANGLDIVIGGAQSFDRITVDYIDAGSGSTAIGINGGSTQTIANGGTGNCKSQTVSVAAGDGTRTINLRSADAAGNKSFVSGVRCWLSTQPRAEVVNCGVSVSSSSGWTASGGYGLGPGFLALKGDLNLINLGINDARGNTTPAAYQANITNIVANIQAIGATDSILFMPTPIADGDGNPLLSSYLTTLQAVATAKNVPLVIWPARFGTYAQATAAGILFDNLHPNGLGYADEAFFLAQLLAAA